MVLQLAATFLLASLQTAPKDAQTRLKVGDAWTSTLTQTFLVPGTEEIVEGFTYRVEAKVLKATTKGLEVEERTELLESRLGDIVVPPPKGATPQIAKVLVGFNGERTVDPPTMGEPLEFRLSRLLGFVGAKADPAGSDSRWSVKLPGAEGQSVPAATVVFELTAGEQYKRRPSTWYAATFREEGGGKPMWAAGTFVIDDATKLPVVIEVNAVDALIPGGDGTRYDLRLRWSTEIKGH
ncbi:MAG: hypothetical protein HZC36_03385 [Armatimonadetes bacterium]|nr:hypothetical protein [Armatimonadota bacterium]